MVELKDRVEWITVDRSNDAGRLLSIQPDLAMEWLCSRDLESQGYGLRAELNSSSRELKNQLKGVNFSGGFGGGNEP